MQLDDLLVLYVSEKEDNINNVNVLLQKAVNNVIYATDSIQASNQYKKFSPCLIIIHSEFKDSDFVAFLQEVRKDDLKTAFIIITENTQNNYLFNLMELYITKFITKPLNDDILLDALKKAMEIIEQRIFSNVKLDKGIYFNFQTQSIIKQNESLVLNKKESLLINFFIRNQNRILTY